MKRLEIIEVGPRDGLQNEATRLSIASRLNFIKKLIAAGHKRIEIGALVHPERVPQMAGSLELAQRLPRLKGVRYSLLVPNRHGFELMQRTAIREMAVFIATTDAFNQHNINATTRQALKRFEDFVPQALKLGYLVRAYVSTAFGCPYQGKVRDAQLFGLVDRLLDLGATELSIGDTIGVAHPKEVQRQVRALQRRFAQAAFAMHFHDTRGLAVTNAYVAWQEGIWRFDASSGGLGGCPFAPGAAGNVATEDLIQLFAGLGLKVGLSLPKQLLASRYVGKALGRR